MSPRRLSLHTALAALLWLAPASGIGAAEREPYDDFYCTTCHGADGRGNFGVQAPKLAGMEPWYLKRQLEKFREGLRGTHADDIEGRAMQPMAAKLSDTSIEALVSWVTDWPEVAPEPTLTGNPEAGEALYVTCAACHGQHAEGNRALGAPALAGQNDWYLLTQLRNFSRGYRGQDPDDTEGALMRASVTALADEEQTLVDLISYINRLDGGRAGQTRTAEASP